MEQLDQVGPITNKDVGGVSAAEVSKYSDSNIFALNPVIEVR